MKPLCSDSEDGHETESDYQTFKYSGRTNGLLAVQAGELTLLRVLCQLHLRDVKC